MDVDERAVAEIALIENMQRKDLTAWEEADGLAALCMRFGYTHEDVARKVGKSRTTVTEALSIAGIPEEIREECRRADINVKSLLLQVVRQPDLESMKGMVHEIAVRGLKRDDARAVRRAQILNEKPDSTKGYTFKHQLQHEGVRIEMKFNRSDVSREEVINALQTLIARLGINQNEAESDNAP
jgi:ParB family chromosome partitioning protein